MRIKSYYCIPAALTVAVSLLSLPSFSRSLHNNNLSLDVPVPASINSAKTGPTDSNKSQPNDKSQILQIINPKLTYLGAKTTTHLPSNDNDTLWHMIARDLDISAQRHQAIEKEIEIYLENIFWLEKSLKLASPYLSHVVSRLQARALPLALAVLPVIESSYNPAAKSRLNAAGLWQFMPETALSLGLKIDQWIDERQSIEHSTEAALDYLETLHGELGTWPLTIAAYNAGPSRVRARIRQQQSEDFDIWALSLPVETHRYVAKFYALNHIIANTELYAVTLPHVDKKINFVQIELPERISLTTAAELAELPLQALQAFNHELLKFTTPPTGPHHVLIPVGAKQAFENNLKLTLKKTAVLYQPELFHKVKPGEYLGAIAQVYNTSVGQLRQLNHLSDTRIRSGQKLRISEELHDPKKKAGESVHLTPQYHVKKGDTLSEIAQLYGVDSSIIASSNNINNNNLLKAGKVLIIPAKYTPDAAAILSYKVRRGDTLSEIAYRYNVNIADLKRANPLLASTNKLFTDQTLIIPSTPF